MALPKKLKHLNLFNDANSYLGVAKTLTLPKLSRKMEAYRGGGMDGPVKVDLGFGDDGLQLEFTLGGWDLIAVRQFGAVRADGVPLRFAGSVQRDDTGDISAVEVTVRGRHEEIDFGEATPGEDTEHKITTTCSYYKLTVDGEVIVEIDLLNFVFIVDGEDLLAKHRQNIGL
ncbi:phage major tail tube protein [Pseudomonas kuykendallii]|uniref:Phage major tail tube protein n=1 Tax=Pseudomonas kuykendallii TaxID=1007099 RepID=A0A2W5FAR7_9PSED|nr:phage major tail tube protein [Pseudomonas kuykendallii]PZP26689.1 MAG: phage major tail tube protein [Pseudomonas kuykendallii]